MLSASSPRSILPAVAYSAPRKQQHRPVTRIGDKKRIARWDIAETLRLLQFGNDVPYLLLIQIDDSDGIVAELGYEQMSPGQIDRHVIDPALNVAQRDLSFELQRRGARRLRECSIGCRRHRRNCHEAHHARE